MPDLKELLKELVAIPSVNPGFGGEGEGEIVRFVTDWLTEAGLAVEKQEVFPGRSNLVARIGDPAVPAVMLEAHLDTVGVEGWASGSPFDPVETDGRLYGRGSCDTKASLAVFMAIARHFKSAESRLPIVFAATIDEEEKQTGAFRLMDPDSPVGPLEGAITGEPTRLDIIHAHKGVLRFRVRAEGEAAHSAFPERGENAIYRMARAVNRFEEHAKELAQTHPDPFLGRPTINVGTIRGGQSVNVVPDECMVEVDRRLLPSEDGGKIFQEICAFLEDLPGIHVEEAYLNRPGMATEREHPFGVWLGDVVRSQRGRCEYSVAPYMTNGAAYSAAAVPTLVFGPGDIAQAHTRDEFIELDQLDAAYQILAAFLEA